MTNNKRGRNSTRVPVRFVKDDEDASPALDRQEDDQQEAAERGSDGADLTAGEIGRDSAYEDETETQRRIDRGARKDDGTGREPADDADAAGGPAHSDVPQRREDQGESSTLSGSRSDEAYASGETSSGAAKKHTAGHAANPAAEASGPVVAELVATRAELKRVEAEVQQLQDERLMARTEHADLLDKLARHQADFENYRKRVERERGETYTRMVGSVVSQLLPVLDNLRRALDAESSIQAGESEEFRHFLHGVELIYKQLNDMLEGWGLKPVAAVGQRFDPHVHEAVVTEQTDEYEPDTVMQEIVRGYHLGEKLLRPAMVKVATR